MALAKKIELNNGIIVNYHRIVSINKITNEAVIIQVASYTSEAKRQEEIDYYNSTEEDKKMDVYIDTVFINKEYDEKDTIKDLYEYLKTTERFEGAIDA